MTFFLIALFLFIVVGLWRGYREAKNKKQYLVLSATALGIVLGAVFLFGPLLLLSPLKPGFNKIESDNIVLYYPKKEREILLRRTPEGKMQEPQPVSQKQINQMALSYTQNAINKNEQFYKIPVKTKVLLVLGETDLFRFGGVMRGGGTGNEFGIIIDEQFLNEKLITHELAHDTLRRFLGPINSFKLPTWFDEGMSTYLAGQSDYLSEKEAKDLLAQSKYVENLDYWDGFFGHLRWKFTDIQKHRQTYGQVYLFIKYLADTYGEEKLYELISNIKTASFDKAFQKTFNLTPQEAHYQFLEKLKKQYVPA